MKNVDLEYRRLRRFIKDSGLIHGYKEHKRSQTDEGVFTPKGFINFVHKKQEADRETEKDVHNKA